MSDRQLVVLGTNKYGQCPVAGAKELALDVPTDAPPGWWRPEEAGGGTWRVARAALGSGCTLLLGADGRPYAVGANSQGELGRGHDNRHDPDTRVPRLVPGTGGPARRVVQVAAGASHCAAVTGGGQGGGQLLTWGWNRSGQCGTGATGSNECGVTHCTAGALAGASVTFVACGLCHTVALTEAGGVVAFGDNEFGQLGTGSSERRNPTPMLLASAAALDGVRIVGCAAGNLFTHLVSDDGRVFAMGHNACGQLGTGDTDSVDAPTEIDAEHFGGAPVAAVTCGTHHMLALTTAGKAYACGAGNFGRLGLGHRNGVATPQPVAGALADARVVRVAAGQFHSCALTEDGRVFAVGKCAGIPAEGARGIPQLLHGALAGTTVCALGNGFRAGHAAFIAGTPPSEPGFEAPLALAAQDLAPVAGLPPTLQEGEAGAGGGAAVAASAADAAADAAQGGTKRKRDGDSGDGGSGRATNDGSTHSAAAAR